MTNAVRFIYRRYFFSLIRIVNILIAYGCVLFILTFNENTSPTFDISIGSAILFCNSLYIYNDTLRSRYKIALHVRLC